MRCDRFGRGMSVGFVAVMLTWALAPHAVRASEAPPKADVPKVQFRAIDADAPIAWFPEPADLDQPLRPPVQLAQAKAQQAERLPREQALIPLPPSAWTGLAGLALLCVPTCRRMLQRIVR